MSVDNQIILEDEDDTLELIQTTFAEWKRYWGIRSNLLEIYNFVGDKIQIVDYPSDIETGRKSISIVSDKPIRLYGKARKKLRHAIKLSDDVLTFSDGQLNYIVLTVFFWWADCSYLDA